MALSRRACLGVLGTSGLGLAAGVAQAKSVEILEFRLAKKKTVHLNDEKQAKSYNQSFKAIGIPCQMHNHDGHFDLTFECAKWKSAEFPTHAEVEKWQKWLNSLGFETRHSH